MPRQLEILKLEGKGNGFIVKNCRSKKEREYLISELIHISDNNKFLYKLNRLLNKKK
jgi:hypothetical protein